MNLPQQIFEFFKRMFSTADWPPRWHCGNWTDFHGWLYIISDLMIWAAYFAIPVLLFRMLTKRSDLPFSKIFWLFIAFILLCGSTHLMDAVIFWWPAYRVSALIRFITGVVSIFTVYALYKILPLVYQIRTAAQLEVEIEQRKKAEAEVQIQHLEHEKTKELLRVRDEFITLASHELKTPLTSLKGYLQILEAGRVKTLQDTDRQLIAKANKQAEKLARLINDLFTTAKIQLGELSLRKSTFPISEVINQAVLQVFSPEKTPYIDTQIASDVEVEADFDRIEQVIYSLLLNAVKYSSIEDNIEIKVVVLDAEVKVSIIDKGIGITTDKLPHIFDRYYRVENASRNYSGLGIGLYVTSQIIEKHGGRIGVESIINQGSTFWFILPVNPVDLRQA